MLKTTVVFLAVVGLALSAVSRAALEKKPVEFANVKGCYISELRTVVPFGGKAPSNKQCQEYRCSETEVQIHSCGVIATAAVAPPCYVVQDKTKPYPDCCTTVLCYKDETISEGEELCGQD